MFEYAGPRRGFLRLGGSSSGLGVSAVKSGSSRADCMRSYVTFVGALAAKATKGSRRVERGAGGGEDSEEVPRTFSSSSR